MQNIASSGPQSLLLRASFNEFSGRVEQSIRISPRHRWPTVCVVEEEAAFTKFLAELSRVTIAGYGRQWPTFSKF
jgi:hypothetical protein